MSDVRLDPSEEMTAERRISEALQRPTSQEQQYKWLVRYLHTEESATPEWSDMRLEATFTVFAANVQGAIRKTEPIMTRGFTELGRKALELVEVRSINVD